MNVQKDDLAIIVGDDPHAGMIVHVREFKGTINSDGFTLPDCWVVESSGSPFRWEDYPPSQEALCPDCRLRPVKGLPDEDQFQTMTENGHEIEVGTIAIDARYE